jgi:competence protein ComEA
MTFEYRFYRPHPATEAAHPVRRLLLRPPDQVIVATLVLVALGSMAAYWVHQGGLRGDLIEIDRARPLEYRFMVDVNRAEWPELSQLPDVGPILAKRIVEHRQQAGPFVSTNQLMDVSGIGPRKLAQIRKHLLPLPEDAQMAGR